MPLASQPLGGQAIVSLATIRNGIDRCSGSGRHGHDAKGARVDLGSSCEQSAEWAFALGFRHGKEGCQKTLIREAQEECAIRGQQYGVQVVDG